MRGCCLPTPLTGLRSGVLSIGVYIPFLDAVGRPLMASKLKRVFRFPTCAATSAIGRVFSYPYCRSSDEDDPDEDPEESEEDDPWRCE